MTLQKRTSDILEAAIQEFIRTGDPISSHALYERHQFGIRPASIRHELHYLTDEGYLEHPYHSAGRIPTDRGYRFFTERLLEAEYEVPALVRRCELFLRRAHWENLLEALTNGLGVLGVIRDYENGRVYKEGLDDLVENLDWESPDEVREVIRDFEELDRRLQTMRAFLGERMVGVFVGKQSPLTRSERLSVVAGHYGRDGNEVLVVAVGPKRMDYQKVIAVFKNLGE